MGEHSALDVSTAIDIGNRLVGIAPRVADEYPLVAIMKLSKYERGLVEPFLNSIEEFLESIET